MPTDEFNRQPNFNQNNSHSFADSFDPPGSSYENTTGNDFSLYTRDDSLDHHLQSGSHSPPTSCIVDSPCFYSYDDDPGTFHESIRDGLPTVLGNLSAHSLANHYSTPFSPIPDNEHPWQPYSAREDVPTMLPQTLAVGTTRSNRFHCRDCERTFSQSSSRSRHRKNHHGNDRAVYQCPVKGCEKQKNRTDNLRRHVKNRHPTINVDELDLRRCKV